MTSTSQVSLFFSDLRTAGEHGFLSLLLPADNLHFRLFMLHLLSCTESLLYYRLKSEVWVIEI